MKNSDSDSHTPRNRASGLRRKANRCRSKAREARAKGLTWDAAGFEAHALEYSLHAEEADAYAALIRDADPAGFADADLHSISDNACTVRVGEGY